MPKVIDLPEATSSKDNDVIFIDDVDAGISKKITVLNFGRVVLGRQLLTGPANQGLALVSGAAPTYLTNYGSALNGADPVAGTIVVPDAIAKYRFTLRLEQVTAQFNAGLNMWIQADDGVNPIVEEIIGSEWLVDGNQTLIFLEASPVAIAANFGLTVPFTLKVGVAAVAKNITVNVAASSIMTETF